MTNSFSHLPWLTESQAPRIAVLGDLILDEYLDGEVTRISPEAPVPVNLIRRTFHRPGGSANTALNIQRAGGQALILGVCGKDDAGKTLCEILENEGVLCEGIIKDKDRPTTRKTRITANRHQIVRVDWELTTPISAQIEAKLRKSLDAAEFSALLISDYGKGGLTKSFISEAISVANLRGIKVVIDPKGTDYDRYLGAYVITPNRKEACLALGIDPIDSPPNAQLARMLHEKTGIPNILLTLGEDGMLLLSKTPGKTEVVTKLNAKAREVFDVSGAGDTVAALVALGIGSGAELARSVEIANVAAAIVVGKWGTQPIEKAELIAALDDSHADAQTFEPTNSKVKTPEEIVVALKESRPGKRVVFTNGCFDLLHVGHVSYLERARAMGDVLVVGVNSDASVKRLKGKSRPINTAQDRKTLLAGLSCVDFVTEFCEDTPLNLIKIIKPQILVKGGDWDTSKIVGRDFVEANGGTVKSIQFVEGFSTSKLVERMSKTAEHQ